MKNNLKLNSNKYSTLKTIRSYSNNSKNNYNKNGIN